MGREATVHVEHPRRDRYQKLARECPPLARATRVEAARRVSSFRPRSRRVRDPGDRLATAGRSRPRRVPLRLRPALRPRRPPPLVAALPDAGHAAVRRASLDVFDGRLAEPLMALLYAGSIVCWAAAARYFGAVGRHRRRRVPAPLPGLRPHVPRALERARVRSGVRPLGAARRGRRSRRRSAASRSSASASRCSHSFVRGTPCCSPSRSSRSSWPGTWRTRLERTGAFALAAVLPLLAWSVHNGVRFDSWGLARGGNAIVPFYRAFITDHIVSPENGEQSRRLAAAMQQHLLTREPYRSYGVTLDQLFEEGSFRVHEDLYLLSDQVFGWDADYGVLRDAGVEGVRAHPGAYARGVARTVWDELAKAQFRVVSSAATARPSRLEPANRRHRRKEAAGADRGRADPGGSGRLDLAARQEHPAGLDVADRVALRVRPPDDRPRFERSGAR